MNTPDKCPHCGADWVPSLRKYGCMTYQEFFEIHQSEFCKERAAHAATKRELEEMRARVKKFEPYYLDYVSSVSAAGLPADGPCLACNGFGGHEEGCHGTTGLMTMAYELETLRARVRELEGLLRRIDDYWCDWRVAHEGSSEDDIAYRGLSDAIRSIDATLGEAMPRKEGE